MSTVISVQDLGGDDRRRYVELVTRSIDVDLQRELDFDAVAFNAAFVRQTWRKQKKRGAGRGQKSKDL